jgi:hypothetical protein
MEFDEGSTEARKHSFHLMMTHDDSFVQKYQQRSVKRNIISNDRANTLDENQGR